MLVRRPHRSSSSARALARWKVSRAGVQWLGCRGTLKYSSPSTNNLHSPPAQDPTALDEVVTAISILQQLGLGFLGDINLSAVTPQSGDHVAATSLQDNLIQVGNVTLKPMGTMVADRTQGVSSFDPDYFYFSCAFNTGQSLVTPSSGCTISVTGFFLNGVQTQTIRFKSTSNSLFAAQMTRANLPLTWVGLQNMTIGIEEADFTPALTIGNIDSFSHCNRPIIV